MIELNDNLTRLMKELKNFSAETYYHSIKVKKYTYKMIKITNEEKITNFSDQEIDYICKGALLHDIGKLFVQNLILTKDSTLSDEEKCKMREHTDIGAENIGKDLFGAEKEYVLNICKYHHDRIDGEGFHKIKEFPIYVQIVSLCDAFEALCANRIYRPAYPVEKALEIIDSNGCGAFDPKLVQCIHRVAGQDKVQNN